METWKIINGYEDYQISNFGNVISLKYGKVRVLKPTMSKGYCHVDLGFRKTKKIHRLVGIYFIPNPDNKLEINHKDGNKLNNHYTNLEWNTASENKRHALLNGLRIMPNGGNHHNSKLTEKDVLEIRKMGINTIHKIIAEKFNISKPVVTNIINRKSWKHI